MPTSLDRLLDARATCRNFDSASSLPVERLAQVLKRSVGARGRSHDTGFEVLKKAAPSGGALHPTECYVIARQVDGLARGVYHYRPVEHALQAMPLDADALCADARRHARAPADALDYLAWIAVGAQAWFADAHALCVLAPRFERNFWKYRHHPKAYRVCILDVGHVAQTLQLAATDAGLGSFVTAAINEADIERALGLAHWRESPLAVCGIGLRAGEQRVPELDPGGTIWPRG